VQVSAATVATVMVVGVDDGAAIGDAYAAVYDWVEAHGFLECIGRFIEPVILGENRPQVEPRDGETRLLGECTSVRSLGFVPQALSLQEVRVIGADPG